MKCVLSCLIADRPDRYGVLGCGEEALCAAAQPPGKSILDESDSPAYWVAVFISKPKEVPQSSPE
jgi:hypothetical protein